MPQVNIPSDDGGMIRKPTTITLTHLHKKRGSRNILSDIDATINAGKVTGLIGENGAGKSSLIRCIVGLDRPTQGQALIGDRSYRQLSDPLKTVGTMLDGPGAHPKRSARQHLVWLCAAGGIPSTRADEMLERVGLSDAAHQPVGTFSLGMTQRLSLAQALLGNPSAVILDEPFNGLDPQGIRQLRSDCRQWAQEGRTVLISSHLIDELEGIADNVIMLDRGHIIAAGSVTTVQGRHASLEESFFAATGRGQ